MADETAAVSGDRQAAWDQRKKLGRVLSGMRAARSSYDPHWGELARFNQPRLARHLQTGTKDRARDPRTDNGARGDEVNSRLLDSRGIWASEVYANGMDAGMSSPSRPWFTLTTQDPDMREYKPVKEYLDEVKRRIYLVLSKIGWYQASKEGYLDGGVFGTEACVIAEHWDHLAVVNQQGIGEYYIDLGEDGIPNRLYRRMSMTAEVMAQRFPGKLPRCVKEALTKTNLLDSFEVWHAIEPNESFEPGRLMGNRAKRWSSYYWADKADEGRDPAFLRVSGYTDKPFYAARSELSPGDTYGRSRGMIALPELRQLQLQHLRKQQATDLMVRPPIYGPQALTTTRAQLAPGGVTALAGMGDMKMGAVYTVPYQAIGELRQDIDATREVVDTIYYVRLFQAITSMEGVQPRNMLELQRRYEEQMQQLGPLVSRYNTEKLTPTVERIFMLLLRAGQLPPAPPELKGQQVEIEFISIMAELQRATGLRSIENTLSFVGSLIAAFPEAGDKIDVDQAIDEYAAINGAPASMIRSDDEVAEIRAGRAQQQQAAQMAEMAPAMADGAQAAQILANTTNQAGEPLLGAVLGNA